MITEDEQKLKEIKDFIAPLKEQTYLESQLIAVLHRVQHLYNYLPKNVLDDVADEMKIPTAHIWGVATFYHYFNLTPPGKYIISICLGTACYVKGAGEILETLKQHLRIDVGQVTEDGLFSIQPARCVGACGLAPVMMIDEKIYGDLTPERTLEIIEKYRQNANDER